MSRIAANANQGVQNCSQNQPRELYLGHALDKIYFKFPISSSHGVFCSQSTAVL
jgi:hypothetical protein